MRTHAPFSVSLLTSLCVHEQCVWEWRKWAKPWEQEGHLFLRYPSSPPTAIPSRRPCPDRFDLTCRWPSGWLSLVVLLFPNIVVQRLECFVVRYNIKQIKPGLLFLPSSPNNVWMLQFMAHCVSVCVQCRNEGSKKLAVPNETYKFWFSIGYS